LVYVGWKIFAYAIGYSYSAPSTQELCETMRATFTEPEWFLDEQGTRIELTHLPTKFSIKVGFEAQELTVDGEKEIYLLTLSSHCFAFRRHESDHKQLMVKVIRMMPWRKAAIYLDNGKPALVHWRGRVREDEGLNVLIQPAPPLKPIRYRRVRPIKSQSTKRYYALKRRTKSSDILRKKRGVKPARSGSP